MVIHQPLQVLQTVYLQSNTFGKQSETVRSPGGPVVRNSGVALSRQHVMPWYLCGGFFLTQFKVFIHFHVLWYGMVWQKPHPKSTRDPFVSSESGQKKMNLNEMKWIPVISNSHHLLKCANSTWKKAKNQTWRLLAVSIKTSGNGHVVTGCLCFDSWIDLYVQSKYIDFCFPSSS